MRAYISLTLCMYRVTSGRTLQHSSTDTRSQLDPFLRRPMALMLLCEFILNSQPAPPGEPFLLRTLLELYLADALPEEAAGGGEDPGTRVPAASSKARRCVEFIPSTHCTTAGDPHMMPVRDVRD